MNIRTNILFSLLAAVLLFDPAATVAQESPWREVEIAAPPPSGLPSGADDLTSLYRVDEATARMRGGPLLLQTTDAGRTWDTLPRRWPTWFRSFGTFLVAFGDSTGAYSPDSGRTWRWFTTQIVDRSFDRPPTFDGRVFAHLSNGRLTRSLDSGRTWTDLNILDSVRTKYGWVTTLHPIRGAFPLPHPDSIAADSAVYRWKTAALTDSSTMFLALEVSPIRDGWYADRLTYYGVLDLESAGITWRPADDSLTQVLATAQGVTYAFYLGRGSPTPRILRRSADLMQWETRSVVPQWVIWTSVYFAAAEHIITPNAQSRDGGRTWTPLVNPYRFSPTGGSFCALDSLTYLSCGKGGELDRSTDGGATWTRNTNGSTTLESFAFRGDTLVVSIGSRSLYRSTDAGATWLDASTALPPGASIVTSLGFTDSARSGDLFGLAAFAIRSDSLVFFPMKSNDVGLTWTIGAQFDGEPTWFSWLGHSGVGYARMNTGSLLASTDGGLGWERRSDTLGRFFGPAYESAETFLLPRDRDVLRTTDGGRTWETVITDAPRVVYLGNGRYRGISVIPWQRWTQWRIWASDDYGETWRWFNGASEIKMTGFPFWLDTATVMLFSIETEPPIRCYLSADAGQRFHEVFTENPPAWARFVQRSRWTVAATDGHRRLAFYKLESPTSSSIERDGASNDNRSALSVAPNPALDGTIEVCFPTEWGPIRSMDAIDALGRIVRLRVQSEHTQGEMAHLIIDAGQLSPGGYLLRVTTASRTAGVSIVTWH